MHRIGWERAPVYAVVPELKFKMMLKGYLNSRPLASRKVIASQMLTPKANRAILPLVDPFQENAWG